ncbi:MAG TPA: SPOR domain-containing protein [Gemmatimonas sp.]|nr:SPOR domain-containing protein [Gemmatimonas sp.]
MTRMLSHVVMCLIGVAVTSTTLRAQAPASPPPLPSPVLDSATQGAIMRARGMANAGQDTLARALLDSIVAGQESGSEEFAEAVYWRAVLADRAAEAERDWKRLTIEAPLSPRMPDALLWLAELEMVRAHAGLARGYLNRLLLEHSGSPQRHKAMVWIARTYFDERDYTRACTSVRAMQSAGLPDGELRLQSDDMQNRCNAIAAAAAAAGTAPPGSALPAPVAAPVSVPVPTTTAEAPTREAAGATSKASNAASNIRYSVQLAAFNTRAEATRMVKRMATRKVTARIDGDRKPFRVRSGRYTSESAAKTALAALKKRGITGIVVESTR